MRAHRTKLTSLSFLLFTPPPVEVSELSVVLDSSFLFDVEGTLVDSLEYVTNNPGAAYSTQCSEVCACSRQPQLPGKSSAAFRNGGGAHKIEERPKRGF